MRRFLYAIVRPASSCLIGFLPRRLGWVRSFGRDSLVQLVFLHPRTDDDSFGCLTQHSMSYYTTKILAEKFARQLSQPGDPCLCAFCFADFAKALANNAPYHLPRLRAECHVLFDACICVLCLPRALDDFEKLESALAVRHLRCSRDGCASSKLAGSSSVLRAFLDALVRVVHAGLHLGDHSASQRALNTTEPCVDRQDVWPSRVSLFFPYGEQATFDALLNLANLFISESPLGLMNKLLSVYRAVFLPILLVESNRKRLVDYLLRVLDPRERPALEKRSPWLFGGGNPLFSTAMTFIHAVQRGPGDAAQLFAGRERALLRVVSDLINTLDGAGDAMGLLVPFALDLGTRVPPPRPPLPDPVREWMRAHRERHRPSFGPVLYAMLTRVAHRGHCAAATCAQSDLPTERLQVCARCKVPRYCSKTCQADDWRGGGDMVPHRMMCGIFLKIAASCADLSAQQFAACYGAAEPSFDRDDCFLLNAFASTVGRTSGHEFTAEELQTFPRVAIELRLPEGAQPMLPCQQITLGGQGNFLHFDNNSLSGSRRRQIQTPRP